MASYHKMNTRKWIWPIIVIVFFIFSRYLTWQWKPLNFSEIIYSYMPYAHLWASGTRPYLDQWYEYPPATIPIFYIPHLIDMATLHHWYHLDYGQVYRLQMLVFDSMIFLLIWRTLIVLKIKRQSTLLALGYYMLTTLKAHDFIYDTMDISFSFFILASATLPIIFKNKVGMLTGWLSYFLAVGLKLLNAPLALLYLLLDRNQWKKSILMAGIAFILIWGLPMVVYRSSLQVLLVYQNIRGLQIDAAGTIVGRIINNFTQTETVIEVYKNYELSGPYSTVILQILNITLPVSILIFVIWFGLKIWQQKSQHSVDRISLTLGYILLLMLVSKVLSRPFMLWHIPLLAIFPFRSIKEQLLIYTISFTAITVTMSALPNALVLGLNLPLWAGIVRTVCFIVLFVWWLKRNLIQNFIQQQQHFQNRGMTPN